MFQYRSALLFRYLGLPVSRLRGYRASVEMGLSLMQKTSRRARAIAIAQTRNDAALLAARLLVLTTGATAACIAYMICRAV
jgi:hypothetical protein